MTTLSAERPPSRDRPTVDAASNGVEAEPQAETSTVSRSQVAPLESAPPATESADANVSPDIFLPVVERPDDARLIEWNGDAQYIHGANLPWVNYGCDFGCGNDGGVSSVEVQEIVASAFGRATQAGMTHVRWWMFADIERHVVVDEQGRPIEFTPDVFRDLDAALLLAEAGDVDLILTLFAGPTELPAAWLGDTQTRALVMEMLGRLFDRYADHPRIMTWQVMNEPEWPIWNNLADPRFVQTFVADVARAVHENTSALVSVGGARLDGVALWSDLGLDYLTIHWYDNMRERSQCLPCVSYSDLVGALGIDVPVLVGEFHLGEIEPLERLRRFHGLGYAGSLAWSLLPDRTFDRLEISFDASSVFAAELSESD